MKHVLAYEPYFFVPALHDTVESAVAVHQTFNEVKPDCIVVEIAEPLSSYFIKACARLPDISVIVQKNSDGRQYHIVTPADAFTEATRLALEHSLPIFCIDLAVNYYPNVYESYPDPYAMSRIGTAQYYFQISQHMPYRQTPYDIQREIYMAKRIRELSFSYDRILVVTGMHHIQGILSHIDDTTYPEYNHASCTSVDII